MILRACIALVIAGTLILAPEPTAHAQRNGDDTGLQADQRERIKKSIQLSLNILGFAAGRPDGKFGRKTRAAIQRYQRSIGLKPTGTLTGEQVLVLIQSAQKRGDVLKERHQLTDSSQPPENRESGFARLPNVDLRGGDLRDPRSDPNLKGIGVAGCETACKQDSRCKAFTYNTKVGWCFLKHSVGEQIAFRGAVSGTRHTSAPSPEKITQSPAQDQTENTLHINMLSHTFLRGRNFRNGNTDPKLKGITRDQCQQYCVVDERCKAYTHNTDKTCFLLDHEGTQVKRQWVSSGIILKRPRRTKWLKAKTDEVVQNAAGLHWREGDTEASFVKRIRQRAVPFGGSCKQEEAVIERLQQDVKATLEQEQVSIGKTASISWSGNTLAENIPIYLMVATSAPVRFAGKGFYTLMPNAMAAFGIETYREKSRAIVALYGAGAAKSGKIEIEPVFAGRIKVEFAIVGYQRKCSEELASKRSLGTVKVVPAALPVIETDDRLIAAAATRYLVSRDKSRLLDERSDGTWRLIDAATRTVIVNRDGTRPRFSSTGRFVLAQSDDGYDILDALDGKILGSTWDDTAWENYDSFIRVGGAHWGVMTAANLLNPRISYHGGGASRASGGRASLSVFDLENNLHIVVSYDQARLERLDNPDQSKKVLGTELDKTSANLLRAIARYGVVAPVELPKDWEIRGGESITHIHPWLEQSQHKADVDFVSQLRKKLVPIVEMAGREPTQAPSQSAAYDLASSTRGFVRSFDKLAAGSLVRKLSGFGLNYAPSQPPSLDETAAGKLFESHSAPGKPQQTFGRRMFRRIVRDVPRAAKIIPDGSMDWGCAGRAFDYVRRYEFEKAPLWIAHLVCQGGNASFYNSTFYLFSNRLKSGGLEPDLKGPSGIGTECWGSLRYCETKSALFSGRYLAIWSAKAQAAAILDLEKPTTIFRKFELPRGELLEDIRLDATHRHVVQLNTDGTFFVHRIADGKTVLEGRAIDDEIVVWTPDMHFDATAEGAQFVNLRFPGQVGLYTFQQFSSRLKVPGLLSKVLSGDGRLERIAVNVPPRLSGTLRIDGNRIRGSVNATSVGALDTIRVYQDGVLTDETAVPESGGRVSIDVERLPGVRWVSLMAVDAEGLVSLPIGRDLGGDDRSLSNVRLLSVGIDRYDDAGIGNLNFAKADAERLSASLSALSGKAIELQDKIVLSDKDATPEKIMDAARELVAASKPGEMAVFSFAGHGVKGEDGRFYLATSSTDARNIADTALAWNDLAAILGQSKARVTVFLDACHSGAAGTELFTTNDDAVSGILKNLPSGLTVLSASKGRQLSEERADIGGGVFTTAVADVIAGKRAAYDLNRNGRIEVTELYLGVKKAVVEQTDGRQTPWLARNQMIGNFALF